jgi:general secretion pathway protein J
MIKKTKQYGFTLIEVIIASTIAAFIMAVSVGALQAISMTSERVEGNLDTTSELRYAAGMISTDLINIYRDSNTINIKMVGRVEESQYGSISILTFYALERTRARIAQPEGDIYEVEYFLKRDEQTSVLMRRLWPNPNKEFNPAGILTGIAENIEVFAVRYFDGQNWLDQWPEEMESLPQLVEVSLSARSKDGKDVIGESFISCMTYPDANSTSTQVLSGQESSESTGTSSSTSSQTGGTGQ